MFRREFLTAMGTGTAIALLPSGVHKLLVDQPKADATLRISQVELEIAPGKTVKTTGYNGSVPGPLLRFREGQQVIIDVINDTKEPELVHWHGLFVAPEVDGSEEEGTPLIPAKSSARYSFVVQPSGTRWYHSHVAAGHNLSRATYTGQFGMFYVEPRNEPGRYDREVQLCLHGWKPYLANGAGEGTLEPAYNLFSINSHALGHGEPIKVKQGQRVLFRILNANATMTHQLALAGHQFQVISLDGNAVPNPSTVETLKLGPAWMQS
jgi:FtsP/CotA-like multicopper oxidase with cupredoxin domain